MKKVFIIDIILEIIISCLMILSFIYSIIYNEYVVFAFIALLFIINSFALFIVFSNYIKNCDLFISDYNFFKIANEENVVMNCRKLNTSYFLDYNGQTIEFRSNEKLFGNQMFFAYVVRNIRYFEVSIKRPMIFLFKKSVKLKNMKLKNLTIVLDGEKIFFVKNGVSKCKFTLINKAWYWRYFLSRRAIAKAMVKDINFIDEKKFQSGRISYPK